MLTPPPRAAHLVMFKISVGRDPKKSNYIFPRSKSNSTPQRSHLNSPISRGSKREEEEKEQKIRKKIMKKKEFSSSMLKFKRDEGKFVKAGRRREIKEKWNGKNKKRERESEGNHPFFLYLLFYPLLLLKNRGVTWYATERRKVRLNYTTLCVWTYKPRGLTTKAVRMKVKQSYLHSMTYNWLDREGNVGHCSRPSRERERERKKKEAKWLARAFRVKNSTFSSEEIWKRIFSF